MSDPLKNKMFNYEVTPPEGVWKNVASNLQESNEYLALSAKMYDVEVMPPATSWAAISQALGNEQPIRARPVRRLIFKLAAAAVLLGVILTGSLYFLADESQLQTAGNIKEPVQVPAQSKEQAETNEDEDLEIQQRSDERIIYAVNEPRHTSGARSSSKVRSLRKVRINEPSTEGTDISVPVRPIRNEWGDIIQDPQIISNGEEYISVTGPNGQQTRISAKFIDALQYLNGSNTYSDYADASYYESASWQRKFEEWRNKIMQTSYIPSSTNFLDIMEFKELISKDNQQ